MSKSKSNLHVANVYAAKAYGFMLSSERQSMSGIEQTFQILLDPKMHPSQKSRAIMLLKAVPDADLSRKVKEFRKVFKNIVDPFFLGQLKKAVLPVRGRNIKTIGSLMK